MPEVTKLKRLSTSGALARLRLVAGVVIAGALSSACSQLDEMEQKPEVERLVSRTVAPGYRAYDTEWALIIASDPEIASNFAEEVRSAAASFYTTFGVRVPPGCVRVIGGSTLPPCEPGAAWTMDWPAYKVSSEPVPPSSYWRLVDFGLLRDNYNNRAASALGSRKTCEAEHRLITQAGMLRHELMHQFFIRLLWPNTKGSEQYGGGAPDWLDEAAALASEPPYLVRTRRARFMQMLENGTVIPMDRFLRMEHPIMASIRAMPLPAQEDQTTVTVRRQSIESGEGARLVDFYAQARAFSDYLMAVSHDRRILRLVTTRLKEESSLGQIANVPSDEAAIEESFLAWVRTQKWDADGTICR